MLGRMKLLARYSEITYALMRVITGLLFAVHGAQKLFGVLGGHKPPVGSQLWIGAIIELAAGALIALGFYTRAAAFLASGTMAVAYTQFHWKFALDSAFFPVINKGELALVYAFVFLFVAAKGAGTVSLDRMLGRAGA
jgi:putative oxidoreductase